MGQKTSGENHRRPSRSVASKRFVPRLRSATFIDPPCCSTGWRLNPASGQCFEVPANTLCIPIRAVLRRFTRLNNRNIRAGDRRCPRAARSGFGVSSASAVFRGSQQAAMFTKRQQRADATRWNLQSLGPPVNLEVLLGQGTREPCTIEVESYSAKSHSP